MEGLIKISHDPIPSEQHSLPHTAALSQANLSLLMSQLPRCPSTLTVKSLLQKTRHCPIEDRTRNNCPERDGRSYTRSCKVSFKSTVTAFLVTENKCAFWSSCHSTASFSQRQKNTSHFQQLFRTCLEENNSFPCKKNICNVQHGCSTFTCDESDHRDNELLE